MIDGVSIQSHVMRETTFRADMAPSAATEVPFEDLRITPEAKWIDDLEYRATHNQVGFYAGDLGGKFRYRSFLRIGDDTRASSQVALIANALGADAAVSGGDVTFNFNGVGSRAPSLTFLQQGGGPVEYFAHSLKGCVTQRLRIKAGSGQPTAIEGEGEGAEYSFFAGGIVTLAEEAAGQQVIELQADKAKNVVVGTFIKFGSVNDNSGAGYQIVLKDEANDTVTITPGIQSTTVPAGTRIVPLFHSSSVADNYPTPTVNRMTLSSSAFSRDVDFIDAEIVIDSGLYLNRGEGSNRFPDRVLQNQRKLSGRVTMYLEDEQAFLAVAGLESPLWQLDFEFGDPANDGKTYTFSFPNSRIQTVDEIPFSLTEGGVEVVFQFTSSESPTSSPSFDETVPIVEGSVQSPNLGANFLSGVDDPIFNTVVGAQWTVSFWLKASFDTNLWQNNMPLVGKGINQANEGGWNIGTNFGTGVTGSFWAETETPGNDHDVSSAFWGFNDGFFDFQWDHFVFALDTLTPTATVNYKNGSAASGLFTSIAFQTTRNNNSQPFRVFGGSGNGYLRVANNFSMNMVDLAIWPGKLTAADVTAIYNGGVRIQPNLVSTSISLTGGIYYTLRNLGAGLVDVMGNAPTLTNTGCVGTTDSPPTS